MVRCLAKMRDGSQCINTASAPKGISQSCRVPAHMEQVFADSSAKQNFSGDVAAFVAQLDEAADAKYQAWLEAQWQTAATQRGLKDGAAKMAFIKDCRKTEAKRVSRQGQGSWALAYRTFIRAQAEQIAQDYPQTDSPAVSPRARAFKEVQALTLPSGTPCRIEPANPSQGAAKKPAASIDPKAAANSSPTGPVKPHRVLGPAVAAAAAELRKRQLAARPAAHAVSPAHQSDTHEKDNQVERACSTKKPAHMASQEEAKQGSLQRLSVQGSRKQGHSSPSATGGNTTPFKDLEQQPFFQDMLAKFQQETNLGNDFRKDGQSKNLVTFKSKAEAAKDMPATLDATGLLTKGSVKANIDTAAELIAAHNPMTVMRSISEGKNRSEGWASQDGSEDRLEDMFGAGPQLDDDLQPIQTAESAGDADFVTAEEHLSWPSHSAFELAAGFRRSGYEDDAEELASRAPSLAAVGAVVGAAVRGFVQTLTSSMRYPMEGDIGQEAKRTGALPHTGPLPAISESSGAAGKADSIAEEVESTITRHLEGLLKRPRHYGRSMSVNTPTAAGLHSLAGNSNKVELLKWKKEVDQGLRPTESDLEDLKLKHQKAMTDAASSISSTQELMTRLRGEASLAESAAEQQSSVYAHFLFQDVSMQSGPTVTERVEMFNAVSKAASEMEDLSGKFETNLETLRNVQKMNADLEVAAYANQDELCELQNAVKYALETSVAIKVMLSACQKTATELAGRVASARLEQNAQVTSLEEQIRQREELILAVKAGTDAANALKVFLETESVKLADLVSQLEHCQSNRVGGPEAEPEPLSAALLLKQLSAVEAATANMSEVRNEMSAQLEAASGERLRMRAVMKKGSAAAAALQKSDTSCVVGSKSTVGVLERTRAASVARAKLKAALEREQDSSTILHERAQAVLRTAQNQEKRAITRTIIANTGSTQLPSNSKSGLQKEGQHEVSFFAHRFLRMFACGAKSPTKS